MSTHNMSPKNEMSHTCSNIFLDFHLTVFVVADITLAGSKNKLSSIPDIGPSTPPHSKLSNKHSEALEYLVFLETKVTVIMQNIILK